MPFPTPNGPTINDLQYQSFGVVAAFNFNPVVFDRLVPNENIVLDLVGYSGKVDTSDFIGTSESLSLELVFEDPIYNITPLFDRLASSENVVVTEA